VFCVDDKTAIQALDTITGRVDGKVTPRHTSAGFVDFLGEVAGQCRPKQGIHIILDNLSTHKTQAVRDFLDAHPEVRLHRIRSNVPAATVHYEVFEMMNSRRSSSLHEPLSVRTTVQGPGENRPTGK
jgi:hypothetical protein